MKDNHLPIARYPRRLNFPFFSRGAQCPFTDYVAGSAYHEARSSSSCCRGCQYMHLRRIRNAISLSHEQLEVQISATAENDCMRGRVVSPPVLPKLRCFFK
ncbi:uncharacterized protein PV06_07763 [Exophiala oligosperma]|uniref:Uncharacterized protein n=1 Tax=Exophiala oligosperma TaxID=215243 RepID=A0A0D2DBX1_9EURO|nr:uncharacterized protein PV06_07763 [Exophiala oligosperma]KIW40578.1 hypothetical protein PV06_07763 [Exophiala oligosperma]